MTSTWSGDVDLKAAIENMVEAARAGLKDAGDDLLQRSQALVPTDSGGLRSSGSVKASGETVSVEYSAPYAVIVHERTDVRHDDGQAKFLEQPFLDTDRVGQVLAEKIRGGLA